MRKASFVLLCAAVETTISNNLNALSDIGVNQNLHERAAESYVSPCLRNAPYAGMISFKIYLAILDEGVFT